jgi:hypothetical protein
VPALSILRALGRGSLPAVLRQVVAVALVGTAATTFALFSPAYRYAQSEGYRQAAFELWVNGPLDDPAAEALHAYDPAARVAVVADVTPRFLEAGDRRVTVTHGRFFRAPDEIALVYPEELRVAGSAFVDLVPGEIILDQRTADALAVGAGDIVTASLLDNDGRELRMEVRVAALVLSTAHLGGSVGGILSPEWRRAIPPDIPPYSSVYLATGAGPAIERAVEAMGGGYQVFRRADLLHEAEARASQLIDGTREAGFLVLAAAVLAVFVTRDLRALLRLRMRACAVLIALGIRPGVVARAIMLEQAVLLSLALALGVAAGTAWFRLGFHLPLPVRDLGLVTATFGLLTIGAMVTLVLVVRRDLERVPVTRLLFDGA